MSVVVYLVVGTMGILFALISFTGLGSDDNE
jgi:glycopeptide antibiotics resistance protein